MLISFFYANGIVRKEFVPPGHTVNQQFYLEVLKRLCNSVQKKKPEMWSSGDWFLHHDNAPAHTALRVQQFLAKNNTTVISYIWVPPRTFISTHFLCLQFTHYPGHSISNTPTP